MQFHGEPTPAGFPQYDQTTTPAAPSAGEFWWDRNVHVLKRYDGAAWQWVGLDDLKNVDTTGKADTNIVEWDNAASQWVDAAKPAGGGGGSAGLVHISTQTLVSDTASISFSSLASTYRDLLIVGQGRSSRSSGGNWDAVRLRVGATSVDTGTNYTYEDRLEQDTFGASNITSGGASFFRAGNVVDQAATTTGLSPVRFTIWNYATTGQWRTMMGESGGAAGTAWAMSESRGAWTNTTDAIDVVELSLVNGNWKAGTTLRLYGMQ